MAKSLTTILFEYGDFTLPPIDPTFLNIPIQSIPPRPNGSVYQIRTCVICSGPVRYQTAPKVLIECFGACAKHEGVSQA